jgi:hypothetical protein
VRVMARQRSRNPVPAGLTGIGARAVAADQSDGGTLQHSASARSAVICSSAGAQQVEGAIPAQVGGEPLQRFAAAFARIARRTSRLGFVVMSVVSWGFHPGVRLRVIVGVATSFFRRAARVHNPFMGASGEVRSRHRRNQPDLRSGPGDRSDAVEPGQLVRVADGVDAGDATVLDGDAHRGGDLTADVDPGGG